MADDVQYWPKEVACDHDTNTICYGWWLATRLSVLHVMHHNGVNYTKKVVKDLI
jgi:hypothetical protein